MGYQYFLLIFLIEFLELIIYVEHMSVDYMYIVKFPLILWLDFDFTKFFILF